MQLISVMSLFDKILFAIYHLFCRSLLGSIEINLALLHTSTQSLPTCFQILNSFKLLLPRLINHIL